MTLFYVFVTRLQKRVKYRAHRTRPLRLLPVRLHPREVLGFQGEPGPLYRHMDRAEIPGNIEYDRHR